jgi:hypothetical protein
MKSKLLALFLLAGSSLFARGHFSIGIGVGGYYPYGGYYGGYYAPPIAAYGPGPVYGAPGNVWINGYYYPVGARRVWRAGYWATPPYAGAIWVGPRWSGGRYSAGYWRRR